ncbi:DUF6011 domain-containing protein [Streptomyces sp. NPDC001404]|uniref:DUF6011 domain-containing protein n=1 Tax=Streptomyces sp. NPDC001404 TaxID=3364571 RepID=UPI0036973D45
MRTTRSEKDSMQHATGHTNCLRCGRALRSALSTATGYGPTCLRRIKAAARRIADHKPALVAKAIDLIDQGGLVPLRGRRVFQAVASNGTSTYKTAAQACTCPAGIRGLHTCYHRIAAQIVAA